MNKQRLLKADNLSSSEYAAVKNLKAFNSDNYKWDSETSLYKKI